MLFGRDEDIAKVAQLARSGRSRLITLTGPGGVGKTRLAMAVCQELMEDYPDGLFGFSLDALARPGSLSTARGPTVSGFHTASRSRQR